VPRHVARSASCGRIMFFLLLLWHVYVHHGHSVSCFCATFRSAGLDEKIMRNDNTFVDNSTSTDDDFIFP
jgi:hypothetical protein